MSEETWGVAHGYYRTGRRPFARNREKRRMSVHQDKNSSCRRQKDLSGAASYPHFKPGRDDAVFEPGGETRLDDGKREGCGIALKVYSII